MSPSDFFLGTTTRLDALSILLLNQSKKSTRYFYGTISILSILFSVICPLMVN